MGNKAGKIWGQTELILANSSCEFHRIDFVKGGTCSKHKHEYKWNGFYCMSGKLKIKVWQKSLKHTFQKKKKNTCVQNTWLFSKKN